MNQRIASYSLLLAGLGLCAALSSCGSQQVNLDEANTQRVVPTRQHGAPSAGELAEALLIELEHLGVDPLRVTTHVPTTTGVVFDLRAVRQPVDGGVELTWTYRNIGDYDLNGEVNISDVTPLASHWQAVIAYDDPETHAGIAYWPSGLPADDGGATPGNPPLAGSGADNWRLAQVDGDANGEINISDLTSIGSNFGAAINGYNIYRRAVGDEDFAQVGSAPIPYSIDSQRPLRLAYLDEMDPELVAAEWEYFVRAYDDVSGAEGHGSGIVQATNELPPEYPRTMLEADVTQGLAPLAVSFTASAETAPLHMILLYEWDFEGDGEYELQTGTEPTATYTYETSGVYVARLRVTEDSTATAVAGLVITVGGPPVSIIEATPLGGEVPMQVVLEGRRSYSPSSEIKRFEWDMDNDGIFEVNSGPISRIEQEYTAAGAAIVGLRVTDAIDETDTEYITLEFADSYEEVEHNDTFELASPLGLVSIADPAGQYRGSIGNGGYDGDEFDWYSFAVNTGAFANLALDTSGLEVSLRVRLMDTNTYSTLYELAQIESHGEFRRGLRGAGTYFICVENVNTTTGLNYDYTLTFDLDVLSFDESEVNDVPAQANDLGLLTSSLIPGIWGNLGPDDGDDWFGFSVVAGDEFSILLDFFHHEADLELALHNADASVLLGVSESVNSKELIELHLDPGDYLVHCYHREGGIANYELQLFFTP